MKLFLVTLLVAVAAAVPLEQAVTEHNVYGYITKYGIPAAERIQKAEEEYLNNPSRIVGGSPAALGQYPYQAGLISDIIGITGRGVCGGSLVTPNRVITAAHCWFDGLNQGWRFTVVLGSVFLFSGGTRIETSAVASHPNYSALLARNDVAVIYLPSNVALSDTINTIALPSGAELQENFVGDIGLASGFGITTDGGGISTNQFLSHVSLTVITNDICRFAFPLNLQDTNVCTSGIGGTSVCSGDSGGPLVVTRNNRQILIGITSFGSPLGCQVNLPAAFARVTSFMSFFQDHI